MFADRHRRKHALRKHCENCIIVVFADREVNVSTSYNVLRQVVHLLQMDPFFSVGVVANGLLLEAVVELHELHDILGCFFEYNQAVD